MTTRTMFDKIWQRHVVVERGANEALLYVDTNFVAESCGGAGGDRMLTEKLQPADVARPSVAEHCTCVAPIGKLDPEAGAHCVRIGSTPPCATGDV